MDNQPVTTNQPDHELHGEKLGYDGVIDARTLWRFACDDVRAPPYSNVRRISAALRSPVGGWVVITGPAPWFYITHMHSIDARVKLCAMFMRLKYGSTSAIESAMVSKHGFEFHFCRISGVDTITAVYFQLRPYMRELWVGIGYISNVSGPIDTIEEYPAVQLFIQTKISEYSKVLIKKKNSVVSRLDSFLQPGKGTSVNGFINPCTHEICLSLFLDYLRMRCEKVSPITYSNGSPHSCMVGSYSIPACGFDNYEMDDINDTSWTQFHVATVNAVVNGFSDVVLTLTKTRYSGMWDTGREHTTTDYDIYFITVSIPDTPFRLRLEDSLGVPIDDEDIIEIENDAGVGG
jgi:hypothetical protein